MKTIQHAKIQLFFELSVFFVKKKLRHSSGVCPVHGRAGSGGGFCMPGRQSVWPAHRRGWIWGRAAAAALPCPGGENAFLCARIAVIPCGEAGDWRW